jgi:S-adenosylmethionine synthetase
VQDHEPALSPDGKTQVAVEYRDHRPVRIHSITLVACQYDGRAPKPSQLAELLRERVVHPVFSELEIQPDERTKIAVNPEGPVVPGGPVLHAGLTGRKTAVDGYGDFARSGAAARSGKDPSRIDRSGSYAARHAARNVVAAGLAERCEVQLCYAIGQAHPVSVLVDCFGTGQLADAELVQRLERTFDFRPAAIVKRFGLRSLPARRDGVFYRELASYGQVGRDDLDLPWERLDHVDALR